MAQLQVSKDLLDKVSFLVGDWRGTGVLDYPGPPVRRSSFDILAACKISPKRDQLLLVTFDDDRQDQSMFHATQGFIYVEGRTGELRIKRHWLMESDPEGFITVEKLTPNGDGQSFGFTVVEREGVPNNFQHDGTLEKISESEFIIRGEVKVGDRKYPYVDKYTRRTKPVPK